MKFKKRDLFIRTQNRLTLQYSVLIMIFITLFIVIVYFLMRMMVSFEQERLLFSNTDQQLKVIQEVFKDKKVNQQELEQLSTIRESGNQFFYLVLAPNGSLLFGDSSIPRIQPRIARLLEGWAPEPYEIRYDKLILSAPPRRGPQPVPPERELRFMMMGVPIVEGGQVVGYFYTGRDITFVYELLNRLMIILVVLGILFWGVGLLLSYFMSKKAMVPIRGSFLRQREFVADASHELRTPLSILHTSLDVLEMEDGEKLSDYSHKVLDNMRDETRRMTSMVGDLLTLARSDSGSLGLSFTRFDLIPRIQQLIQSANTLAKTKKIDLQLESPVSFMVQADEERLTQLLYILLDNAIKYTPNGGKVSLRVTPEPQHVRLIIKDTGLGIPEEEQSRIFERFYRVNKNRSREMGGTGLGLAIAKWIVEAHEGSIEVSSQPGEGATFTVRLPTAK
ncbi:cell wall metabolism sensor histidine kinase WalK [Ammoniphilus sp. YIM 78166]|uniref:sensor histidine kinase n=1 Tax=Ammoniphilus sp. YIM 78166 TaxID=1644106 RepID=UPI00107040B5|nr:ATP-binding protein [Ammoniphilus sp. YIM 78166]